MFDLTKITKDYSVILVDLDNTLFNYTIAHNEAILQCSNKFNFSLEEYEVAKVNIKKRNLQANHHKKELYFKNICEMKNISLFVAFDMYEFYTKVFYENLLADDSMLRLLSSSKKEGKQVIAITNYYVIPQIKKLKVAGYENLIDHLITSEEFEVEKPNVKLLERAIELSGENDKDKFIMFGDSVVDDMGVYNIKYSPYNCSKLLISISGKSGAGKSTISNVIKEVFEADVIEADGYHKYERNHKAWNTLTHYDPKANNLIKLGLDIKSIYQDISSISVPIYNHKNGKFSSPNKLNKSADVVIIEGLHTLYKEVTGDYVKIKIFIDSKLADFQKIKRDVNNRNKTEESVKESIQQRENDYEKYIQIQKQFSNFIVDIDEDENVSITISDDLVIDFNKLSYKITKNISETIVYCKYIELNSVIKDLMILLKESRYSKESEKFEHYTSLLDMVGNILDSPGMGGNISVKNDNQIMVKSSGADMKNPQSSCSVLDMNTDEVLYSGHFDGSIFYKGKNKKPTMEYPLHKLIKSKYVVHYHPVYILPFLCSDYSFGDRTVIDYINPGEDLSKALEESLEEDQPVIFLRNHGVIIHSNCLQTLKSIYNSLKSEFFIKNNNSYTPDDYVDFDNPELWLFRNTIENLANSNDISLKTLSEENKDYLDFDENEKYRMNMLTEKL